MTPVIRPPTLSLYDIVIKYRKQLPFGETSSYMHRIFLNTLFKGQMDSLFFAYVIYTIVCTRKKWFVLTTTPPHIFSRLLVGFFVP